MVRELALVAVVAVVGGMVGGTPTFFPYETPTIFPPPTFYDTPTFYTPYPYSDRSSSSSGGGGGAYQVIRVGVDASFHCPKEGFYANPANCSQFYRCVDYTTSGQWFVKYLFECPKGHFFAIDVTTCLPGPCDRTQPPGKPVQPPLETALPPVPPTDPPAEQTKPPVTETTPPAQATTQPSVQPTDPPPVVSTEPPTQPPKTTTQSPQPPTQPPPPPTENCRGQYMQHEVFCNVYTRCNETGLRYMCPPGTVFDAPRQMCRISAADEGLCAGKSIAAFPQFLRTELVDGHILLQDDYVLTPLGSFPQQAPPANIEDSPPLRLDIRSQVPFLAADQPPPPSASSPFLTPGTQAHFDLSQFPPLSRAIYPAASSPSLSFVGTYPFPAPYNALPADTLPLPGISVPIPRQSLSIFSPKPISSPYSLQVAAESSVNNVRRPLGPLHSPPFTPYSLGVPPYNPYYGLEFYR